MIFQTVTLQVLTSLKSWVYLLLFENHAVIANSEFAKRVCKHHTASPENYLCLLMYLQKIISVY